MDTHPETPPTGHPDPEHIAERRKHFDKTKAPDRCGTCSNAVALVAALDAHIAEQARTIEGLREEAKAAAAIIRGNATLVARAEAAESERDEREFDAKARLAGARIAVADLRAALAEAEAEGRALPPDGSVTTLGRAWRQDWPVLFHPNDTALRSWIEPRRWLREPVTEAVLRQLDLLAVVARRVPEPTPEPEPAAEMPSLAERLEAVEARVEALETEPENDWEDCPACNAIEDTCRWHQGQSDGVDRGLTLAKDALIAGCADTEALWGWVQDNDPERVKARRQRNAAIDQLMHRTEPEPAAPPSPVVPQTRNPGDPALSHHARHGVDADDPGGVEAEIQNERVWAQVARYAADNWPALLRAAADAADARAEALGEALNAAEVPGA